jgi:hypothetical protein
MKCGTESTVYGDLPERLLARRVAILSESDHPAAGYMALALQRKIAEVPSVERIDYYPPGYTIPRGERVPDIVLRLEVADYRSLWLPFYYDADVKAAVDTRLSPLLVRQLQPSHWSRPTPWVQHCSRIGLAGESTIWGPASHKLRAVAEKAGEDIGSQITGSLSALVKGKGVLGALPDYLTGEYREIDPVDAPILARPGIREVLSGSAPLHRHMSVWRLVDLRPRAEVLKDVAAEMEAAGWTRISDNLEVVDDADFVKGTQHVAIQAEPADPATVMALARAFGLGTSDFSPPPSKPPDKRKAPTPGLYLIHCSERLSDAEMDAVLRRLLDDPTIAADDLLAFGEVFRWHSRKLWEDLVAKLGRAEPRVPRLEAYVAGPLLPGIRERP